MNMTELSCTIVGTGGRLPLENGSAHQGEGELEKAMQRKKKEEYDRLSLGLMMAGSKQLPGGAGGKVAAAEAAV